MSLALHYDFANDRSLVARVGPTLSIVRATPATYFDNSGLLATAGSGIARFGYHPTTLESLGLLTEVVRTNIALHNRDWANAVFTPTNITAVKDAVGLDGAANSASTLTATANNGTIIQSITAVSAAYITTVWMKRKTGSGTVEITDNNFTNATDITADINASTWSRVGRLKRTQANPVIGIRLGTSGDEVEVDYVQTEIGTFATLPIETTTDPVLRGADDVQSSDMSWFDPSQGSFQGRGLRDEVQDFAGQFCEINEASGARRLLMEYNTGGTGGIQFKANMPTTTLEVAFSSAINAGVEHKFGMAFQEDDMFASLDGVDGVPDTAGTVIGFNPIEFHMGGNFADTGQSSLYIKDFRYYNTRLPNETITGFGNGIIPTSDVGKNTGPSLSFGSMGKMGA